VQRRHGGEVLAGGRAATLDVPATAAPLRAVGALAAEGLVGVELGAAEAMRVVGGVGLGMQGVASFGSGTGSANLNMYSMFTS
jgi:hypothetical protein